MAEYQPRRTQTIANCPSLFDNMYILSYKPIEPVCKVLHIFQSLESAEIHQSFKSYSRAFITYESEFLYVQCLQIFIESLVRKAREVLESSLVSFSSIFCSFCGDVLRDPITLPCGHMFSKECALSRMKNYAFHCVHCSTIIVSSTLTQLKSNIVASEFLSKVWNDQIDLSTYKQGNPVKNNCILRDLFSTLLTSKSDLDLDYETCLGFVKNPSPKNFLNKADLLVTSKKYFEAIYLYLIYIVFVPNAIEVKTKLLLYIHKLLLEQHRLSPNKGCWIDSNLNNSENVQNIVQFDEIASKPKLHLLIRMFCDNIEHLSKVNLFEEIDNRTLFRKYNFECSLCMQLYLVPITTQCGHTFCQACLQRWLDHQPTCPLCKTSLNDVLIYQLNGFADEFIEQLIIKMFPHDYSERKALHMKDMEEIFNTEKRNHHIIPIFVCTIAFPTILCPLHVYEPRYKLLIRQCVESGSYKFGMCALVDNNIAEYGTMLILEDVCYFPDGQSVVRTVGCKRFRVMNRSERDGYQVGVVEFLKDKEFTISEEFMALYDYIYKASENWFRNVPTEIQQQILHYFGEMPEKESYYFCSPDGPSWMWWVLAVLPILDRVKIVILSMTSLTKRLLALKNILVRLQIQSSQHPQETIGN